MKTRVTITVDSEVVRQARRVAQARETSLSAMIESLLREQLPGESQRSDTFSQRWQGWLSVRDDSSDPLLKAIKAKHAPSAQ
jgi:Arc/MetJ-type ribon-helix-helix transcriptional regulator